MDEEKNMTIEMGCVANGKGERIFMVIQPKQLVFTGYHLEGKEVAVTLRAPVTDVQFEVVTQEEWFAMQNAERERIADSARSK